MKWAKVEVYFQILVKHQKKGNIKNNNYQYPLIQAKLNTKWVRKEKANNHN